MHVREPYRTTSKQPFAPAHTHNTLHLEPAQGQGEAAQAQMDALTERTITHHLSSAAHVADATCWS